MTQPTRRRVLAGFAALALGGCTGGGHFTVLGYTSRPNYDERIRTVYVPLCQNETFQAGPFREQEAILHRTIIKQIEQDTPFKVVHYHDGADTELLVTVVRPPGQIFPKFVINRNLLNEVREGEVNLGVEVVWRDLRLGELLSQPKAKEQPPPPFDPRNPAPPPKLPDVKPVLLVASGRYLPELGESIITAQQFCCDKLSRQIVHLMERPW